MFFTDLAVQSQGGGAIMFFTDLAVQSQGGGAIMFFLLNWLYKAREVSHRVFY